MLFSVFMNTDLHNIVWNMQLAFQKISNDIRNERMMIDVFGI